jgi:DNA gyrase subunit A
VKVEYTEGKIIPISIGKEMSTSYLNYAMSVIIGRALPDVRDGLKPVHRRVLYGMSELNLSPDKPYKKSARVVGEVMGKYHPHGDTAIYDTIVRMAQDFSQRYILVDGHGNFGSVDGDAAAAMRYTEVRLSPFAMELLRDINKDTVDFQPNFDDSLEEPVVLPSRVPNLLVNGSSGIAVGMATNIPPHNLREVIDGVLLLIDDPDVSLDKVMKSIKGPDFPTGGLIIGRDGIKKAYRTGKGTLKIRAKVRIEQMNNGKNRILVYELPYQVNKAKLLETIADLVRDKKIEGITDLRDESDRTGMRIIIELRRDANPNVILNQLYKHTQMQVSFGIINLAIVDGQPKVLNLKEMLYYYLEHQKEVITRRTRYDLRKAEERAHILEGLRIALSHLDEIIKLIRGSKDTETAKKGLMENFSLSEKQAVAILEMRLARLTGLERDKIEAEYKELMKLISHFRKILENEHMVYQIIREELSELRDKFGDERRTEIAASAEEIETEDLIAEEDIIITLTHSGYIKRLAVTTYRSQRRGGRGVKGMNTKEDDFVEQLFITTTHHNMLFFTNRGKVYRIKAYEIPEASRTARGTAIINLIQVEPDEKVTAVIPVKEFNADNYLVMATKNGIVKKTDLSEFDTIRKNGLIAVNLHQGDELISVRLTDGKQKLLIGTEKGQAIVFKEEDIRSMGRTAAGVKGIALAEGDSVVGMDIVSENADVLTVTSKGLGKRTPISQYRVQSRGGKGITNIKLTERSGKVITVKLVREGNEIIMTSRDGIIICIKVDEIPRIGRATQGSILMKLADKDEVVDVAQIIKKDDEDGD